MPEPSTFAVFAVAALALLVVPGPSVLYIVGRSIEQGRQAGFASVLGVHTGSLAHITAAALGVSAVLVRSAALLTTVKLLGAAYLIGLGLHRLLRRVPLEEDTVVRRHSLRRVYLHGIAVNVLNPKTALFFFAFLPQFVDPDRGAVAAQVLVLGACFVALGIVSDGTYALAAGTLRRWLASRPRVARRGDRAAGAIYLTLGIGAALSGRPAHRTT